MKMDTSKTKLKIIKVEFIRTKSSKVKARADVYFDGFLLRGFKVLWDEETGKDYVTPPSYLSPSGWRPIFRTSKEDWQEICRRILKDFNHFELKETADEIKEEDPTSINSMLEDM